MRLQTRAPGKINVCLLLGPPRASDGRHELASVVQAVTLADRVVLELDEAERGDPQVEWRATPRPAIVGRHSTDRVECEGVDPAGNLALRAIALFRRETGWDGPPVTITIDKRIPVAGGMAGGSADAGAALRLLHHATGGSDLDALERVAAELGADVPSQVRPARMLITGAGERLERVPGISRFGVVVVPDSEGLATAEVFREADRLGLCRDAAALAAGTERIRGALPDLPGELCVNELEPAALSLRPRLATTLAALRESGADVAMISGSGPTALGLFHDDDAARDAAAVVPGAIFCRSAGRQFAEVT